MKLFCASYKIGNATEDFRRLFAGKRTALIANATDWHKDDVQRAEKVADEQVMFADHGGSLEDLDLRAYFGKSDLLAKVFAEYDAVWVRGGNTFTLRQAMFLSGFDHLLLDRVADPDFVYGGYSAGICILAPDLHGIELADEPTVVVYPDAPVLWDGLGIVPYSFLPHYQSDHEESALVDTCLQYCIDHKIPFKALRDDEVLLLTI